MPLHDFILPKSDTNSTVFDFLVIFCSFYVYSLVPGVWHLELLKKHLLVCSKAYVSMPSRAYTSFLLGIGLFWSMYDVRCVNALSGLYLISTVFLQKPRFYAVSRACFCRYLSEYSDNSSFSCMLTFWTYLMRCTYPWHWIKYSTKYNRCHPFFHSLDKLSWAVTRYPPVLLLRLLCAKCILLFIELL